MPLNSDRAADIVAQAVVLAQEVGGDIASVLFTHFADADTLDTLRPGGMDLATVTALNRAVATELAAQGVEVLVQRADRAAFRRWMQGRDDTPQTRRRWVDRERLIRGEDALRLLGVAPKFARQSARQSGPPPPRFGIAPGPIADRLLAAFDDEEGTGFEALVEALLTAGRHDVFDLVLRKAAQHHDDDTADALEVELLAIAEEARIGPSGWSRLMTLPVALPAGALPDATAIGAALVKAGIAGDTVELRFLPGWRSPNTLAALPPLTLRRVLLDLVAGIEPRDLPPADTDELGMQGFGVLLGLEIDWGIPVWEEIAADGPPDADEESPEDEHQTKLFDAWRGTMFEAHGGCVPLALVPPSEVGDEIAAFLGEAGEHTDTIDEVREAIAMARREAGAEEVVCRVAFVGHGLSLALHAQGGRFLDSLTLAADRMPIDAEAMVRLIETFVRVVREAGDR